MRPFSRAEDFLDVVARGDGDHPHAEVEYAPHLAAGDATRPHEHPEHRRPLPGAGVHHRFAARGQDPGEVPGDTAAGDMRQRVDSGDDGRERGGVTAVHVEQDLRHRAPSVRKRIAHVQPQAVEHDLSSQGVPVGVQPVGRAADQHVARPDPVAVQRRALLHNADDGAREVVVGGLVEPGQLRRLTAGQRHLVRAAPARDARDDRGDHLGHELTGGDVVQERDGRRAVDEDVVDAVVHQVLAHRVVNAGTDRHEHLRPHAVGGQDQDRAGEALRDAHHATESADGAERQRSAGRCHQGADAPLRLLSRVEVHASRGVALGHRSPSSTSKCTSSLKARTRARTSAGFTLSNPWMPNASTANEPIAAPYTMARRRLPGERPPLDAR